MLWPQNCNSSRNQSLILNQIPRNVAKLWPRKSKNTRNSTKFADKKSMSAAAIPLDFTLDFNWCTFLQPRENSCSSWYSSTTGRFLQEDPEPGRVTDPSTVFNKYIYSRNAPNIFKRPEGENSLYDNSKYSLEGQGKPIFL